MKQEIVCNTCYADLKRLFPKENPYPGEHVKFVKGRALKEFICDNCGCDLKEDDEAVAFTIWADHARQPYKSWESEYLK